MTQLERTAHNFAGLDIQELIDVQAVYINDYKLAKAVGDLHAAAAIYRRHIEPLGEYIDSLDGTR